MILSVVCTKKTGKVVESVLEDCETATQPFYLLTALRYIFEEIVAESRQKKWQQIGRIDGDLWDVQAGANGRPWSGKDLYPSQNSGRR